MIANYLETSAAGTTWRRCCNVFIDNAYGSTPVIRFGEEKIFNIDGEIVIKPSMPCATVFSATGSVPLVDPETNLPTGETITHAEIYRILHSAYLQAAITRDAEEGAGAQ